MTNEKCAGTEFRLYKVTMDFNPDGTASVYLVYHKVKGEYWDDSCEPVQKEVKAHEASSYYLNYIVRALDVLLSIHLRREKSRL